jgi:dTDP-4-amino-4,6-dideoxygalactose transaminase
VVSTVTELRIPFNRASILGHELDFVAQAVENGHISGDGPFTRRCEELLEQELGVSRALLTTSCTHALELAALLLDVGPGDQVVIPAFTFVSGANAFALRGAELVFADIRPDTLNLDERQLEGLVTEQTRVIVPTHYAGVGCELDAIGQTADRVGAVVVEDNAHGLFGRYRGQALGTFGALAAQSFHETKNVTCGEGGAILVNDASLVESAEIIREKGTDRKKFFRGQVDKYTWVGLGSSYVQSDLLAAFLYAQLEAREQIQRAREGVWRRYADALEGWAGEIGATLPFVPGHCEQAYHMFYVLLPSLDARARLIAHLRERGILAVFHYLPLHLSEMGRRFGGRAGQCPVAEDATERLLRLPFFTGLSESDQDEVIDAILAFAA